MFNVDKGAHSPVMCVPYLMSPFFIKIPIMDHLRLCPFAEIRAFYGGPRRRFLDHPCIPLVIFVSHRSSSFKYCSNLLKASRWAAFSSSLSCPQSQLMNCTR